MALPSLSALYSDDQSTTKEEPKVTTEKVDSKPEVKPEVKAEPAKVEAVTSSTNLDEPVKDEIVKSSPISSENITEPAVVLPKLIENNLTPEDIKKKIDKESNSSDPLPTPERANPESVTPVKIPVTPLSPTEVVKETVPVENKVTSEVPELPASPLQGVEFRKPSADAPEDKPKEVVDTSIQFGVSDDKSPESKDEPYKIFELLDKVIALNASDLHLTVGYPPYIRVDGKLNMLGSVPINPKQMESLLAPVLGTKNQEQLEINKEVDFSYGYGEFARFRVNAFNQRNTIAAAFRLIPTKIPTLEELHIPKTMEDFTKLPQGFVLIVGPTGSGKSTTLASMLNIINMRDARHILTVEDPIEYVYPIAKSIVEQREVSQDTHSWDIALRSALREDPNVVLVGEMRDFETIAAALTVAETGHLVFATLHTNSASQAVDRIIHVFPADQQAQIRIMLANVVTAIVSQRLIPTIGGGRRAAFEILIGTSAVSNMIREAKEHLIDNVIQTSADVGMVTMEKSLVDLIREGKITVEDAQNFTTKPEELMRLINKE
ncbi:MAG: type IV pilus twitching motility protein PilT [bacterium]